MWSEGHHAETVCRQDFVLLAQSASITHLRDEERSKVQVHINRCLLDHDIAHQKVQKNWLSLLYTTGLA